MYNIDRVTLAMTQA